MGEEALDLLRELLDEMRGLRADLAGQRRRLAPADHQALALLLPVLAAVVGPRAYSVAELRVHATLHDQTELRDTLARAGAPRRRARDRRIERALAEQIECRDPAETRLTTLKAGAGAKQRNAGVSA